MVEEGGIPTLLQDGSRRAASRWGNESYSQETVASMWWTRPNSRPAQFEHFHVDRLVAGPPATLTSICDGAVDVPDVLCGTQLYRDLLSPRSSLPAVFVEGRGA
jgi:hypothetical protein